MHLPQEKHRSQNEAYRVKLSHVKVLKLKKKCNHSRASYRIYFRKQCLDQPIIPIYFSFPPMPPIPEPQMQPYNLLLRFGNVSKCHGCASLFDKTNEKLYVFGRKEDDRWEKENKDLAVKQFSCLLARRPLLKKENITILCESDKVHDVPEWIKELQH